MDYCESGNCGSTSFRVGNDGFTYCSEGHQQTLRGTQVADDNDGVPQFGRKARRLEEVEEVASTVLTGKRAFDQYLVCFQFILWNQVHWLVSVQKYPAELETVIRNLWGLRLQTLQSRANYDSESEADHSSQKYSSQSEGETTDATTTPRTRRSKTDVMPQLVDALSLCYIGCLLLRLPTTVNDFSGWVASGQIIYYRAFDALARVMTQNLPFNYSKGLKPSATLKPSSLHKAVLDNIIAYDQSFGMLTPAINHVLVLYKWVGSLALPLEVYAAVLRIAKMLHVNFSYETEAQRRPSRLVVLRFAEAKLMALVVIATKLLFPMDGLKRFPRKPTELSALAMDWTAWVAARQEYDQAKKETGRLGYEDAMHLTEEDMLKMSNDKLDDYMDWYGSLLATEDIPEHGRKGRDAQLKKAIFRRFPVAREVRREPSPERGSQETDDSSHLMDTQDSRSGTESQGLDRTSQLLETRLRKVQAALKPLRVKQDSEPLRQGETIYRPGSRYKRYREVGELSGHAEDFYKEAAKVSGLPLEALVRGVFTMEKRLQDWEEGARRVGEPEDDE